MSKFLLTQPKQRVKFLNLAIQIVATRVSCGNNMKFNCGGESGKYKLVWAGSGNIPGNYNKNQTFSRPSVLTARWDVRDAVLSPNYGNPSINARFVN